MNLDLEHIKQLQEDYIYELDHAEPNSHRTKMSAYNRHMYKLLLENTHDESVGMQLIDICNILDRRWIFLFFVKAIPDSYCLDAPKIKFAEKIIEILNVYIDSNLLSIIELRMFKSAKNAMYIYLEYEKTRNGASS
jgi:hypothetical protein